MAEYSSVKNKTVPESFGPLAGANGNARLKGSCEDTMEFWIKVDNGIIAEARFTTDGCLSSLKCGAAAAAICTGVTLEKAEQLTQNEILAVAGDVPEESCHCAQLASDTLKKTIANYRKQRYLSTRTGDKKPAGTRSVLNPKPQLLVSCRGKDGKDNALVVVYGGNWSFSPPSVMIGIVPSRYSWGLVKETGCFVVNLTPPSMKNAYDYLGSHSGRDEDKLAKIGVRTANGIKVNAPILLDCPVNIECTVTASFNTGSHEMFIGKIEYVHGDSEIVAENGSINWDMVDLM
ncbi:MAG: hypothetical protein HKM05_06210 [Spirochaetales bacterium]|nr:hypothetical protein [Spirochaetales bacterium]